MFNIDNIWKVFNDKQWLSCTRIHKEQEINENEDNASQLSFINRFSTHLLDFSICTNTLINKKLVRNRSVVVLVVLIRLQVDVNHLRVIKSKETGSILIPCNAFTFRNISYLCNSLFRSECLYSSFSIHIVPCDHLSL